ncbi:MAG TPA: flagellar export chaperone FliS [Geminicoccaceae bacterium]
METPPMDPMRRALTAYGQAAETLPPLQQIVMLYDGTIRRLKEARAADEAGRVGERWTAVGKAAAIIDGLHRSLDHERGGEIALNLDRIYTRLAFRLQQINLEGGSAICDEVAGRLGELRAAWAALLSQGPANPGATESAAPTPAGAVPPRLAVTG